MTIEEFEQSLIDARASVLDAQEKARISRSMELATPSAVPPPILPSKPTLRRLRNIRSREDRAVLANRDWRWMDDTDRVVRSPISETGADYCSVHIKLNAALNMLTAREERVIRLRFGIGMVPKHTLEEIGQQFSVNPERIRQIEAKAIRKLRRPCRSQHMSPLKTLMVA